MVHRFHPFCGDFVVCPGMDKAASLPSSGCSGAVTGFLRRRPL